MATGGDVTMSTSAEVVIIPGRVSTSQTKVAPSNGSGKWTVADNTTGVYDITFAESYAQFLGAAVTCEGSTGDFATVVSFTQATRVLQIATFSATTVAADDIAFSFVAFFTESLAP